MWEALLYSVTTLIVALTIYLLLRSISLFHDAKSSAKKVNWARGELQRALNQLNSDNDSDILVGLQTLAALNDPDIRTEAIPKIAKLAQSDVPRVREHAYLALSKLSEPRSGKHDTTN